MGVPAFYRWLHDTFPRSVTDYREATDASFSDEEWPPNANGIEFDNLYLDFNQIVHNATHPSDRPAPPDLPSKLKAIFRILDRLVLAARPRKLLVIALDGVAPRAKMNQQRARRFLAAHERGQEAKAQAQLAQTWGLPAPTAPFDHNAITPGTQFMATIAQALRFHLARRAASSPAFGKLSILLSDAATPGEGEHKIASIIREQRNQPGYDPDTTHLLYGLDADLVMIGLATHERRFYILRDWVPLGRQKFAEVCDLCGREGHTASSCTLLQAARAAQTDSQRAAALASHAVDKPLLLLALPTLREYLLHSLRPDAMAAATTTDGEIGNGSGDASASGDDEADGWWDSERIIDDFICLTFLVGNDFIPSLPTLPIPAGGLNIALDAYRSCRRRLGGYLMRGGHVQIATLSAYLTVLAKEEESALLGKIHAAQSKSFKRKKRGHGPQTSSSSTVGVTNAVQGSGSAAAAAAAADDGGDVLTSAVVEAASNEADLLQIEDAATIADTPASYRTIENKLRFKGALEKQGSDNLISDLCEHYLRAVCWCARYYFQGCADWLFYLPYHYAPFAHELSHHVHSSWEYPPWGTAQPLTPLMQLCCVLPPLSAHLLPEAYRELLTDEESIVKHMYPEKVDFDHRGKKHAWQAVVLLPFIQLGELDAALQTKQSLLTDEDLALNKTRHPMIFTSATSVLAHHTPPESAWRAVTWEVSNGLCGRVKVMAEGEKVECMSPPQILLDAAKAAEEAAAEAAEKGEEEEEESGGGGGAFFMIDDEDNGEEAEAAEEEAAEAAKEKDDDDDDDDEEEEEEEDMTLPISSVWAASYEPPHPESTHRCVLLPGGTPLEPLLTMRDLAETGGGGAFCPPIGKPERQASANDGAGGGKKRGRGGGGPSGGGSKGGNKGKPARPPAAPPPPSEPGGFFGFSLA